MKTRHVAHTVEILSDMKHGVAILCSDKLVVFKLLEDLNPVVN